LVDVPKDVGAAECAYTPAKPQPPARCNRFSDRDVAAAVGAIRQSERPFIYAGGGVIAAGAAAELLELAKKIGAPVSTSLMGVGAYPQDDDLYTGMIGMHGTKASALCASRCDLLIAVGARFSDRVTSDRGSFARQAKILHIDVDPAEINKNISAHYEIMGDAKDVLRRLNVGAIRRHNEAWTAQAMEWKRKYPAFNGSQNAEYPREILRTIQQYAPPDAIYTTEVGQHQMWAAQFLNIGKPRRFISSGGLGAMGFGLGAAIGAAIGTGRRVINIAGDGSFRMNFQEIITAVKYNVPVTIVIMDNHALGMVRQWQKMFYGERYCQTTLDAPIDYAALAASLGARGCAVRSPGELDAAVRQAFAHDGPSLIACNVHEDENVLPMIPGGKGFEDMILEIEE
jgi:acetolactate synthase-1/2/3 large subunit